MPEILIPMVADEMPAYLARPAEAYPVPGVVVIHDVGGMGADHCRQAEWLAEAGFLALAVNLFHRGGLLRCVRGIMRDVAARSGPTFDDIECCRAWLARQPGCNGQVGVIGFCMGGGFAMMLVSGRGFSASSVNYGGKLPADIEALLEAACPVVASYGAKDRYTKGVATQLEVLLEKACVPHDVKEYPDAGHSFMNNHQQYWFKLLRITGIAYNEAAAEDARQRISRFFHRHMDTLPS